MSIEDLTSTLPVPAGLGRMVRARRWRRAFLTALGLVLVLGALNLLGPRAATVRAAGGGYDLAVEYAAVSRPGLATPWKIEVRRAGGFDGPVTVATTAAYFAAFDTNALDPQPASATMDGEWIIWSFHPPPGDTLGVTFDARIEPAKQSPVRGETRVLVDGRAVVSVRYMTVVMP